MFLMKLDIELSGSQQSDLGRLQGVFHSVFYGDLEEDVEEGLEGDLEGDLREDSPVLVGWAKNNFISEAILYIK